MDNLTPMHLVRYGQPSRLDAAPYGSTCKVNHGNWFEMYLQMNKNPEEPRWEAIGTFSPEQTKNDIKEEIASILKRS